MNSERWDRHFLEMAMHHARMSKDPSTRVGAVIVGPDRELLSAGFNGFPRGIQDTPERLGKRDAKLKLVVHAEVNAILAAARVGMRLRGSTIYLVASNQSGFIWGGPPCTRCVVDIIQAGIIEVVGFDDHYIPEAWMSDLALAQSLLVEAGVVYRTISLATAQE